MLTSKGLKRRIVAYLALLVDVLRAIPGAEVVIPVLETLIGALGGSAVVHAGATGTLNKEKIAGVIAIVYTLIAIAPLIPELSPILPVLYKVAGVLSAIRVGKAVLE